MKVLYLGPGVYYTNSFFWANRTIPLRKYSIKAPAINVKTSVYVLPNMCLQWNKWLGPKSDVILNDILSSVHFVGKECFDMQHSHEAMTYQDEVIDEHEPAEKKYFA